MRRLALLVTAVALAATMLVSARDGKLDASKQSVLTPLPPVDKLIYSVRGPTGQEPWTLVWNYTDSLNYSAATLSFITDGHHDDIFIPWWQVEIVTIADGTPTTTRTVEGDKHFSVTGRPNTLKLMVDAHSARLHGGGDTTAEIAVVEYDTDRASMAGFIAPVNLYNKFTVNAIPLPKPEAEFSTVFSGLDDLKTYLATSHDPTEGIWQYLDRDTDDSVALPDGQYTLATVRNTSGGYDIIYLSGAATGSTHWQPMQQKGTLSPTPFPGHYDLTWRDSGGIERNAEQSATLTANNTILTLNFPLLTATLRFYRVPTR